MTTHSLPFMPVRNGLYSMAELLSGSEMDSPKAFAKTMDFLTYRHFVRNGKALAKDPYVRLMQAIHDNSINQATTKLLSRQGRVIAVMGGHKLSRGGAEYQALAGISRQLCRKAVLMVSGGGPGAMEATHLGTALANEPDASLEAAMDRLRVFPDLPKEASTMVGPRGKVHEESVAKVFAWYRPAVEIRLETKRPGPSLGVPTWYYGHEPFTPLASHIAKYFQNSLREDGLLAIAADGVVYAPGKAGTIQEIFQDAAQNYYKSYGIFSPMVLFGRKYWAEEYPVWPLLESLFMKNGMENEWKTRILLTDDPDEVVRFLLSFPSRQQILVRNLTMFSAPRRGLTAAGKARPS